MNAHSQTSDYEKGPNASCTIRPVLSVVASHLEMVPTNESHLLALCARIGFGGEVRFSGETCRPPSEHQGRRPDSRASRCSTLEHERLKCRTSKQPHGAF